MTREFRVIEINASIENRDRDSGPARGLMSQRETYFCASPLSGKLA
jgi:hypothetical protein